MPDGQESTNALPYTAQLPCVLRGSFSRFRLCHPSFYAIGKITKNGWRNTFHIPRLGDWSEYMESSPAATHFGFDYIGPFFICCDHGCTHSTDSHATYSNCQ